MRRSSTVLGNVDILTQGLWEGIGSMPMVGPSSWAVHRSLSVFSSPSVSQITDLGSGIILHQLIILYY